MCLIMIQKNVQNSVIYQTHFGIFESCEDVEDWGSKWTVFSNIEYYEVDSFAIIYKI